MDRQRGMTTPSPSRYACHRFPPEVISHVIWRAIYPFIAFSLLSGDKILPFPFAKYDRRANVGSSVARLARHTQYDNRSMASMSKLPVSAGWSE